MNKELVMDNDNQSMKFEYVSDDRFKKLIMMK